MSNQIQAQPVQQLISDLGSSAPLSKALLEATKALGGTTSTTYITGEWHGPFFTDLLAAAGSKVQLGGHFELRHYNGVGELYYAGPELNTSPSQLMFTGYDPEDLEVHTYPDL